MRIEHQLLQGLNPKQQEAVSAPLQHLLIIAGAGSGKTRVLTQRIAWLVQNYHISPQRILAVTFTNKAAQEMKQRIEDLLQISVAHFWVGTFHGLSHQLLRMHWKDANLPMNFQILDQDDQLRMIKRICKQLELEESKWPPKQMQWYINAQKEKGLRSAHINTVNTDYYVQTQNKVYVLYEKQCQKEGLVDFAELLLRTVELLSQNQELRLHYQTRFKQVMVDEFQDTNTLQYQWLKLFMNPDNVMMVVGDDDQSIYSWRGAQVENMQHFTQDFHPVTTIRLEQNYRSTQIILDAANAVIQHNQDRLGKNLWTQGPKGEPITLYTAFNEKEEAYYITATIQNLLKQGKNPDEIAILYRSNAQSRVLEERLIDKQIPYRIYGGLKFFERAEIKDALSYMRLIANRHDNAAFERAIGTPARGIGLTTMNLLRENAVTKDLSLWDSALEALAKQSLPARAAQAVHAFITFIEQLDASTRLESLGKQTDTIIEQSGLIAYYKKEGGEKALARIENLAELVNAAAQFKAETEAEPSTLSLFLAHVALETGEEQAPIHTRYVSLMTLHAAKGLEFPVVFICGLEEELFPHRMSFDRPEGLEEERRLCYVGLTRAQEKLYLTHAEARFMHGNNHFCRPSRFINEIPEDLIQAVRPQVAVERTHYAKPMSSWKEEVVSTASGWQLGQRIRHPAFGVGMIINFEGQGDDIRLQIRFEKAGTKWLVPRHVKLEVL